MSLFIVRCASCIVRMDIPPRERGKYTHNAEGPGYYKCNPDAPQKIRVIGGKDLDFSDKYCENQHGDAHAEHLPQKPHRRHYGRGDPVKPALHGAHNGVCIG